jgi:hypothetical protein
MLLVKMKMVAVCYAPSAWMLLVTKVKVRKMMRMMRVMRVMTKADVDSADGRGGNQRSRADREWILSKRRSPLLL